MLPHARLSPLLAVLMAAFFGGSAGQGEECAPGKHYVQERGCYPCPQGTYKPTAGPVGCLQCGQDSDGRNATTRGSGAVDSTDCYFRPHIIDFSPKRGPIAGGTPVNVSIGYLEERRVFFLRVAKLRANVSFIQRGDTWVVFTTPASPDVRNGTILSMLLDSVSEYRIDSTDLFFYQPNPSVSYIENLGRGTIISGGIPLVIKGARLTVVQTPIMVITRVYRNHGRVFKSACSVTDDSTMVCITPNLHEGLNMTMLRGESGGGEADSSGRTQPTPPGLLEPGGGGGRWVQNNCTIVNKTRITTNNGTQTIETTLVRECQTNRSTANSEGTMRRKRDVKVEKDLESEPLNNNDLKFFIGFEFDGLNTYANFTSLPVYEDPFYHKFEDADHVRYFKAEDVLLHIKGERLTQGVSVMDILVSVGAGRCNITNLASNRLICTPPTSHPGHGEVEGPDGAVSVEVRVGNLHFFIGYLQYKSREELGSDRNDLFTIIMVTTSVVFLWIVIVWIVITCCCRKVSKFKRRKRAGRLLKSSNSSTTNSTDNTDTTGSTASGGYDNITVIPMHDIMDSLEDGLRQKVEDCRLMEAHLKLEDTVGSGSFGLVYRGQLLKEKGYVVVAVKTLKNLNAEERDVTVFLEEALVMKGFHHPNILPLHGVVLREFTPLVVFEYMDKGDLKSYLVKNKHDQDLSTGDLLGFGLQVAEGMTYLSKEGFVHRDLAARNCLINSDEVVKIGDFGLSRDLHGQDYYTVGDRRRPLPVKWMSAESLNLGKFTSKSDVWSFGVLLWELLSRGLSPYGDVDNSDLKEYINQGYRLSKPKDTPSHVYSLMEKCWIKHPDERPGFDEVTLTLRDIVEKNGFSRKGALESSYVDLNQRMDTYHHDP